MVLKGSLREFILADIFNLIAQQKITGKLILSTREEEGIIAFRDGLIAGATKEDEHVLRKLFILLVNFYNLSSNEAKGLFASFETNINGLFAELINQNTIPRDVLELFATDIVEDITCGFFLWTKGTYYFSSVPYVDDIAPSCVSISVENMAMEAMRRVDEWNRMQKTIRDDIVFVPSERRVPELPERIDPIEQPGEYLFSKIDGISPVASLIRTTCLTEYKVYENLQVLINANRVTPLSSRISQSVVAALEKKEVQTRKRAKPATTAAIIAIGICMACTIIFMGTVFLRGIVLLDLTIDAELARIELPFDESIQKVAIASLQYHGIKGATIANVQELTQGSLLLKTDITPLLKMRSIKELPQLRKNYILYPGTLMK